MSMPVAQEKYRPFPQIGLTDRQWPSRTITKAPRWCAVDLRDGNQALIEPMGSERKFRLFKTLLDIGFKEIEIGFPAASQTDFDFCREIIERKMLADDVAIQVLTQSRDHLIEKTFEAIAGAPKSVVHLYNSTSTLQRQVVFKLDRQGIVDIAVQGAEKIRKLAEAYQDGEILYEYSPESFTQTELDFAVEICEAVMDVYEPTPEKPLILNLPATVEMASANVYADQIEWFCRNIKNRDSVVISLHNHNDRGSGVAATELGLLAGGQRVEGTLFGNGERTGNVDIVTLALNMFTQGVDPNLDFSDINKIRRTVEHCNQLPVHPRHPYAGELVFTAFSGSHQDAIKKGLVALNESNSKEWKVPYLPIDPKDIGRSYEAVIRINSQSGKGGIAYIMETDYGVRMPRRLQIEFSQVIQQIADESGKELRSEDIWQAFDREYLTQDGPYRFIEHETIPIARGSEIRDLSATIMNEGEEVEIKGRGNGPIDAFVKALQTLTGLDFRLVDYFEHAIGSGADTEAIAIVELQPKEGTPVFGVAKDANIVHASLKAVLSAVNRMAKNGPADKS